MRYSLLGDAVAMEFFYIDPGTGNITLKRLLTEDSSPRYNIRVIAILVDLREPTYMYIVHRLNMSIDRECEYFL